MIVLPRTRSGYWFLMALAASASAVNAGTGYTPGVCTGGTVTGNLFFDNVDAGAGSWQTNPARKADRWAIVNSNSFSAPGSWRGRDFKTPMQELLTSPTVVLPNDSSKFPLTLEFQSFRNFPVNQGCRDGGNLQISVNGGAYADVPEALIFADPYTGTITGITNPDLGQRAWCGGGSTYVLTRVDLTPYAGQSVRIRFRFGSDGNQGNDGWHVDDIRMTQCGIVPDTDLDGIPDPSDNCPLASNVDQADYDQDNVGDVCDSDDDCDSVADGIDNCPLTLNATDPICPADGDQTDSDLDLFGNPCDNCPSVSNFDQNDGDLDNVGSVCDNCPADANTDQANADGDTLGDVCDPCPNDASNACGSNVMFDNGFET